MTKINDFQVVIYYLDDNEDEGQWLVGRIKKRIRRNLFETNSSSSHVIVVTKKEDRHITKKDFEGDNASERIWIWDGKNGKEWVVSSTRDDMDFGRRPFQILSTFDEKFRYAVASYGEVTDELEAIAKKVLPEFDVIKLPEVSEKYYYDEIGNEYYWWDDRIRHDEDDNAFIVINGIKKPLFVCFAKKGYAGNIDHQSMGLLQGFLYKYDISLEEFLTNKKYKVIIDGDEYGTFENAKQSGLIDVDNIEFEY